MKRLKSAAVLIALALARGQGWSEDSFDIGSRVAGASDTLVNNQLLSFPMPMMNLVRGRWQAGVSPGYSSVKAGFLEFKGPALSIGATYAVRNHFGIYVAGFFNSLSVNGQGEDRLLFPFSRNVPLSPGRAAFSNARGKATQAGAGFCLVWDPLVKGPQGPSLPMFIGLAVDRLNFQGVKTDYRLISGSSAGAAGELDLSGGYTFLMPMLGITGRVDVGRSFRLEPSAVIVFPLSDKGQKGSITGPGFAVSGDSESAGFSEANLGRPLGAPGLTVVYKPWDISANVGLMVFKLAVGPKLIDEVDDVLLLDLSWRFGSKEKSEK